jgi:formylglycine-generating enzyme required for sulfatase activity
MRAEAGGTATRVSGLLSVLLWSACSLAAPVQDCEGCPPLETLPSGHFAMGEAGWAEAMPVHEVTLRAFAMGKYEVTQTEWRAVMGSNPSKAAGCGDTCPVENVSWNEVQDFLWRLSARTGKTYRLPNEAEWEYACRAASTGVFCGGDQRDKLAWFGKAGRSPHPVGQKAANAWGLHDMNGNVWEWVQDCAFPDYSGAPADGTAWTEPGCKSRVVRGGSWWGKAPTRLGLAPDFRAADIGFRVVREEISP